MPNFTVVITEDKDFLIEFDGGQRDVLLTFEESQRLIDVLNDAMDESVGLGMIEQEDE